LKKTQKKPKPKPISNQTVAALTLISFKLSRRTLYPPAPRLQLPFTAFTLFPHLLLLFQPTTQSPSLLIFFFLSRRTQASLSPSLRLPIFPDSSSTRRDLHSLYLLQMQNSLFPLHTNQDKPTASLPQPAHSPPTEREQPVGPRLHQDTNRPPTATQIGRKPKV
jgi:hypothetical protein